MQKGHIDAFLAVIECGSISGAAQKLYLSQSALSNRILSLERELGAKLFERGKGVRNSELTPFGENFIPIAQKWFALWAETERAAQESRIKRLGVCTPHRFSSYAMADVYHPFVQAHPDVNLYLMSRRSEESYKAVEEGEADIAFVVSAQYVSRLRLEPVYREKYYFVAKTEGTPPERISLENLRGEREIMLDWHPEYVQWHNYWFPNRSKMVHIEDMDLMVSFLEKEGYWAIVPSIAAKSLEKKGKVQAVPLDIHPPERTMYMISRNGDDFPESGRDLLAYMEKTVQRLEAEWLYQT